MSMRDRTFARSPSELGETEFVKLFGGVYEHSPWIAAQTWRAGLGHEHDTVDGLAKALASTVDTSDRTKRLALIAAHPDLAGRAAQRGELTDESTSEQAGAGIDQCTPEEFERFQRFNASYRKKFEFPFVMAVKGSHRHLILAAFEQRLDNDYRTEFDHAISEIHKIARFRLEEIARRSYRPD